MVTSANEFIGIFSQPGDVIPELIFYIFSHGFKPILDYGSQSLNLVAGTAKYKVCFRSRLLHSLPFTELRDLSGWLRCVIIVTTSKGENAKRTTYQQYAGIIQELDFDPGRWAWSGRLGLLHSYSVKKGRTQLLHPRLHLEKPIATK